MAIYCNTPKRKSSLHLRPLSERLEQRRLLSTGTLDPSFGTNGSIITAFGPMQEAATASSVLLQHDGKAVVIGTVQPGFFFESGTVNFAVIRYTTAGKFDPTFGKNGVVLANFTSNGDVGQAGALQADGKIVVAGYSALNGGVLEVARFNTNGSLDKSFGTAGHVITTFGDGVHVSAVAVDSQGRIVVAGGTDLNFNGSVQTDDMTLARYLPNGTLDATFGNHGTDVFTTGPAADAFANAMALQPDGKIVVGGSIGSEFFAARLTTSGALDTTFASGGVAKVNVKGVQSSANTTGAAGVAIVSGGKILLGGTETESTDFNRFALTRLNPNGTLDTTFGASGITNTAFSQKSVAHAMTVQADGKIVLVGSSLLNDNATTGSDYALVARYTANGTLDTTFNKTGTVSYAPTEGGENFSDALAVAVQVDGNILVASDMGAETKAFDSSIVLTRLLGDTPGSISGAVYSDANGNGTLGSGEAGLPNVRLYLDVNQNGIFDSGTDFYVTSDAKGNFTFANLAPGTYQVREVVPAIEQATAPAGGAFTLTLTPGLNLTGENFGNRPPAGALDPNFGANGSVSTQFPVPEEADAPSALLVQHDGKAVVIGTATPGLFVPGAGGTQDFIVARYTTAGAPDPTFGVNGTTLVNFTVNGDVAKAGALQSDGKIVVAGWSGFDGGVFEVARFTTSGKLDTTFGGTGHVTTLFGNGAMAYAVAIDSQGRIVVAGVSDYMVGNNTPATSHLTLVRYLPNGKLDTTFGHNGIDVFATGPAAAGIANAMAIQGDGKIVVGGSIGSDFFAARLTAAGALDSNFGTAGVAMVNLKGIQDVYVPTAASGVAIVAGGKILLGGTLTESNDFHRFALARLNANGLLDTSFGTSGLTTTAFSQSSIAHAMAVQANGSILLVGSSVEAPTPLPENTLVARYTANGRLDTTFDGAGTVTYNADDAPGISLSDAYAVAVQVDGRILVASDFGTDEKEVNDSIVLTRLLGDAPASVSGTVFNDANGNGALDSGEAGLPSVRIYLDLNQNGVYDSSTDYFVTSDAHGNYTLANLAAGTYEIREVIPAGSHLTTPAGGVFALTLTPGVNVTAKNFGNQE